MTDALFDVSTLPARDATDDVLALLAGDPKYTGDRRRIIDAIRAEAHSQRGRVDLNRVRARLTRDGELTVHAQCVGATIAALRSHGFLTRVGWDTNDDVKSGNRGKLQPIYRWHGAA